LPLRDRAGRVGHLWTWYIAVVTGEKISFATVTHTLTGLYEGQALAG